jgi:hypothetical protein
MTLPLPGNPVDDHNIQQKFDAISLAWQDNQQQTALVTASATADIPIQNTDALVIIEFDLESTALCELHLFPNNIATAIYSYVRDGSYENQTPASGPIAAAGVYADANGMRLAFAPAGSTTGGQMMTGRATFGSAIPAGPRRTCIAQTAVSSTTGSVGHVIELQNIASLFQSAVALTSLRFACSAGTMTGRIRVTRG